MTSEDHSGSRFIVDLGEVKLPPIVERQVEAEIQAVVLRALAESNVSGKRVAQARILPSIWNRFPGHTLGLWPGYPNDPPDIFGSGGWEPLVVEDHTIIMKAIMEHPLQVIRYLPNQYKSKNAPRPSGKEVLQAALQVNQIDDRVKARIQEVLKVLPKIEEAQADLPESVKRFVDEVRPRLANKSIEEKCSVLRDAGLRSKHSEEGLAEGMEIAARILEDGKDSIYSPDHSFVQSLQESSGETFEKGSLGGLADTDGVGATAGGAVGLAVGGIGATPGAVIGGAGASAGYAIGWLLKSIFD